MNPRLRQSENLESGSDLPLLRSFNVQAESAGQGAKVIESTVQRRIRLLLRRRRDFCGTESDFEAISIAEDRPVV